MPSPGAAPASRSRARITGTGNDVRLERREDGATAAEQRASFAVDLARMAQAGFSQEELILFARARRSEIPAVWSVEDYAWLRRSGVGEETLGYLASVSAIDIGVTGEPAEAARWMTGAPARPDGQMYGGTYDYGSYGNAAYGYGAAYGYAPYAPRYGRRLVPHRSFKPFPRLRHPGFSVAFPRPVPRSRAAVGRIGPAPAPPPAPMHGRSGGMSPIY